MSLESRVPNVRLKNVETLLPKVGSEASLAVEAVVLAVLFAGVEGGVSSSTSYVTSGAGSAVSAVFGEGRLGFVSCVVAGGLTSSTVIVATEFVLETLVELLVCVNLDELEPNEDVPEPTVELSALVKTTLTDSTMPPQNFSTVSAISS